MSSVIILILLLLYPNIGAQIDQLSTNTKAFEKIATVSFLSPTPLPTPVVPKIAVKSKIAKAEDVNNEVVKKEDVQEEQEESWGVSKQISEHTWTMKVGSDQEMADSQAILSALNSYRGVHGKGSLSWNDSLANYAQSRAELFNNEGKLDEHAGFNSYFGDPENIRKTGFLKVGENSSIGYKMDGVHLIEWVFAGDAPHDNNQLDSSWTAVGIGVSGTSVDIVFGGS